MIRLWALLFGLAIACAAGVAVKATFAKATEQFRSHAARSNPSDLKVFHASSVTEGGQQDHGL